MVNLVKETLPSVSRDFAISLRDRFKPITIKVGIDRDELMISCGEQRVIDYIMNNISVPGLTDVPDKKLGLFERFTNRVT